MPREAGAPFAPPGRARFPRADLETIREKGYRLPVRQSFGRGPPGTRMNLRNLREVDSALVGMIFLMRRAVTTRDDGTYAYAGRPGFALLRPSPSGARIE